MINKLASNVTTAGAQPSVISQMKFTNTALWQVSISGGTATVSLEGRAAPDAPWIQLGLSSANSVGAFNCLPEVRANITAISGATVNVWLVNVFP